MQNVIAFWGDLFEIVSDFLMSPPAIYFVGCLILCFIIGAFRKLINR